MADVKSVSNLMSLKPQYIFEEPDDEATPDKRARIEEDTARVKRPSMHENLCRVLVDVPVSESMPVCSIMRCRYIHDVAKYLQTKPPDIGPECYVFKLKGHCPRGLTCRFANQHITESGRNITHAPTKQNYEKSGLKTINYHSRETEIELRKRVYDFKRAEDVLNTLPKPAAPSWMAQGDIDFTEDVDLTPTPPIPDIRPTDDRIGPCADDDLFKLHVSEKKKINWRGSLYLPPLPNFGNLPYRRICKEFGADITCSEPLNATNILEGSIFDWLLARRHESENMYGLQLFGSNPFILTRVAQLMDEKTNADFLDIRHGHPGEHLKLAGKAFLSPSTLRCLARVTALPITVSARREQPDELVATYKKCQVSMISIISRHKELRTVEWDDLKATAKSLNPIPVFAGSDVFSVSEYSSIRETNPEFAGFMLSRGALVKPWLFTELKQQRDWDISSTERFEILEKFVNYGLDHWGSDAKGVEVTRRFLLDWLSFLCRYIPIGLMERPPQKLNDRCVRFVGRDDLETLLGSQQHEDWVKISEKLLGPVPDGFQFTPKVRQGFWPLDT